MLPKHFQTLSRAVLPVISRCADGREADRSGAFPRSSRLTFRVTVPRRLGAAGVVLRLAADGKNAADLPLLWQNASPEGDEYALTLSLNELKGGLFYYEFLFLRGMDTLFTDTVNGVDFSLSPHNARRFRLLIYDDAFTTPDWMGRGVMYHIFVDRFFRGSGPTVMREDSMLNPDWENGIPQFGPHPGAPVKNNVFFGGNLWGITEKLPELAMLGVTVLYLSPIFDARSNHKYDTGDYFAVDRAFGGEEALAGLLKAAHALGMKVILDGVFNHTGDDSRYFNRYARYNTVGAYQSENSPYFPWYRFNAYPDEYDCWWGVKILPKLNHAFPACRRFFTGPEGVAAHWLRFGIDGWRLDVADELSDDFLDELRQTVKAVNPDAVILGEVWENAADKIAYGQRRRYLGGHQLDSVMNYPLREGILRFIGEGDAPALYNILTELYSSYPRPVSDCLMNLLGTHDTIRILTMLGGDPQGELSNEELSRKRMTPAQRKRGIALLKLAAVIQFTVFGIPSVFYGDEAGLEGYRDPFCRLPYPWHAPDHTLLDHYRRLGKLRRTHPALDHGDFLEPVCGPHWIAYQRKRGEDHLFIAVNRGEEEITLPVPGSWQSLFDRRGGQGYLTLPPDDFLVARLNR